jgi:hypothetical protein
MRLGKLVLPVVDPRVEGLVGVLRCLDCLELLLDRAFPTERVQFQTSLINVDQVAFLYTLFATTDAMSASTTPNARYPVRGSE